MLMNSIRHTQVSRTKLMNIQTYTKNMHQNTTETKAFLLDYISTRLKRFDDLCLTKYKADSLTFLSLMALRESQTIGFLLVTSG